VIIVRWYIEKGPESDVVISSRVRLARNFTEYPFPFRMDRNQRHQIIKTITDNIKNSDNDIINKLMYVDMQSITPIDRQAMVERHLISPELAQSEQECGALVSKDERISIMLNEEDHLRIQCMFAGMQLQEAWKLCSSIDDFLGEKIDFAFDKAYGYLTCCPTNIGTGMRASVMLHLPGLAMSGYIKSILEACSKIGIAVRGLYGENSEAMGNMFQISNQVTLGQNEEEITSNLTNIIRQIIEQERNIRQDMRKRNGLKFEDSVFRALGILSSARVITTDECLKLLSNVRMGVNMGIIDNINIETLNEIMLAIQPATLQKSVGRPLEPEERDAVRAMTVRDKILKSFNAN